MRVKISFLRDQSSANSIPLHHQKLLTDSLTPFFESLTSDRTQFNFSSLKGTSKIVNGFMRMLSSKVTLVISGRNKEHMDQVIKMIFERPHLTVGKMNLMPKNYDIIPDPEFQLKMRYLCISPLILFDPNKETEKAQEQVDPTSHAFSDILYNVVLDRMEKSGYTEAQLNDFAEFEFMPDQDYVNKVNSTGKKFARFYKAESGVTMMGYLIPFTLHAHPEVQKYIWDSGIGVLTQEGYGMVDLVKK
jgi:CRISPR-associated endoribonuclease Cas6